MTGVNSFPRWRGFCDSLEGGNPAPTVDLCLLGNDENEAGNDGSQLVPTLERVLRHPPIA
ncbi:MULTISPECIES: hypothetical protein [unclassified Endozoicomonas]|uniref:hypothetical protein n=1 Tax=unclassified Endozoicomonas TaxID=2644528 RepID=UPI003BB1ECD1